jgi:RNA polymerase sigma-70 factor (ECF subfamily)
MYFSESKEDNMIRDEIHQQVRFLLNRIPEEQAMVIRLRFSDDLTFPEIAEILGIPVTTVKSRFSYGIIKLRSMMKERREADHEM